MIDQTGDIPSLKRFAYWYWSQYLGVPCGADWSTWLERCQCNRKSEPCKRQGKHPIPAWKHLGPFYEPPFVNGEPNPKASPTAPHLYTSREPWVTDKWVRKGYNPTAYPMVFVVVDVEGEDKDGHTSLLRFCDLYSIDPAAVTDTLTVDTGGGGKHHWLAVPEAWRVPVEGLEPYDRFLPGVDLKLTAPGHLDSKATLPGAAHKSGGVYTFELTPRGLIRDPLVAPEALLRAIVQGRRWEPVSAAERAEIETAHLSAAGGRFVGPLPEWRFARRFLGPEDASPPRKAYRNYPGSLGQLPEDSYLRRLAS
jgi:hypothetical protein